MLLVYFAYCSGVIINNLRKFLRKSSLKKSCSEKFYKIIWEIIAMVVKYESVTLSSIMLLVATLIKCFSIIWNDLYDTNCDNSLDLYDS